MSTVTIVGVVVLSMAVSIVLGWPLTRGVLRLASRSSDAGEDAALEHRTGHAGADISDGPEGPRARASLRGGAWIGILERAAITASVLTGFPTAIAFVIAVKGLGRYPELKENPGASERFVIGTLASMLWAAAVGLIGRAVLS